MNRTTTVILLAVLQPVIKVELLVWIFMMRVMMIIASGASYFINDAIARGRSSRGRDT